MENKTAIMLSLGHNSSAIYTDGAKTIGYEEERLNRTKSSSAYPILALTEIQKHIDIKPGSKIYVSHWFNDYDFHQKTSKYFDSQHFWNLVQEFNLEPVFLSDSFTHHDAHAWSALSWVRNKINDDQCEQLTNEKLHIIAADGFGNDYETISIYEVDGNQVFNSGPKLVHRHKGYLESLGLMYQYAVDAVGMKMNQDEYKFLGYESLIQSVVSKKDCDRITLLANDVAMQIFKRAESKDGRQVLHENGTPHLANIEELSRVRETWKSRCDELLSLLPAESTNTNRKQRIIVGHFVQTIIENVMKSLVAKFDIKNLAVAGGIFYNVKLNNALVKSTTGLFSVIPLAGDQGCGPGMYEAFQGRFRFGNLKWGKRPSLSNWRNYLTRDELTDLEKYVSYYESQESTPVKKIADLISSDEIVNIVRGSMEFGPRALCSTTTFALPTRKNVSDINSMNNRDTVMPMAPVMSVLEADKYFDRSTRERIVGSDRFMILTYDWLNGSSDDESLQGVCHKYPKQ